MTSKTCPKCGSRNFRVETKVYAYLLYTVIDGYVEPNGIDADGGGELSNLCICDECGHKWHPKVLNKDFVIDDKYNN